MNNILKQFFASKKKKEESSAEYDFSRLILPTRITNSIPKDCDDSVSSFDTEDYLFLPSQEELKFIDPLDRIAFANDYATINGGPDPYKEDTSRLNGMPRKFPTDNLMVSYFTRTSSNEDKYINETVDVLYQGDFRTENPTNILTAPPRMNIDMPELLAQINEHPELLKIDEVRDYTGRRVLYHTIEMGEWPQGHLAGDGEEQKSKVLTDLWLHHTNKLPETGKKYWGGVAECYPNAKEFQWREYLYDGEKYCCSVSGNSKNLVRITPPPSKRKSCNYLDTKVRSYWSKVKPIRWKILNWDEMPTEINPDGTGGNMRGLKTERLELVCESGLFATPFYMGDSEDKYNNLWQNSTPRGYFNGINVNNITTNGNPKYSAPGGGDFSGENNFLTQAFGLDPKLLRQDKPKRADNSAVNKKSPKGTYGVTVVDSKEKPMPVAEQIEFYINNSIPFMLHGPSGVGKSRRIKDICPDFSSIKLARGMVPENAQGRDVFGFVNGKAESDWAPPAWYKDMCEKAEAKAPEKHILFIDEVTNVDLEQSYLYDIVLERQIAPGIGKFPDNVSVVLAGNEIKDSSVASALAEPLFRRQAHIYLEPNIPDWLEWGSRLNEEGNPNVHPLISDFVASQGMKVFYKEYDTDNPPKHVLDPRGWEQTSDIIYANKGELRLELLANKVGSNIAQNILAFAKQPVITVEDIVAGDFDTSAIPKAYDAKYSMAMRLRNATEEELSPVREFVKKYLGDEMLSVYDATWVGKDKDRAIFLNELKKQQPLDDVEEEVVEDPQVRYKRYDRKMLREGMDYSAVCMDVNKFWDNKKKLAIKCDAQWKADVLMYVFNKMGKTWGNGIPYEVGFSDWNYYKEVSCYDNDGKFGRWANLAKSYLIYNFDDIDYSSVASADEIVEVLGADVKFQMSVDDFWNENNSYAIHCPEKWQSDIVRAVFDRKGKKTASGNTYAEGMDWEAYGEETIYDNRGCFGDRRLYDKILIVYSFEDIDLSKYLTESELNQIKARMPDTAYNNIQIMG